MKTCIKCGTKKPLNKFYKHKAMADGHVGRCIDCYKKDALANRKKRINEVRAYDRARGKLLHRITQRTANTRRWRKKYPGKWKAQYKVNNAIRDGKLKRLPCEVCANPTSKAHHDDYRRPLVVRWLCQVHHSAHHNA